MHDKAIVEYLQGEKSDIRLWGNGSETPSGNKSGKRPMKGKARIISDAGFARFNPLEELRKSAGEVRDHSDCYL